MKIKECLLIAMLLFVGGCQRESVSTPAIAIDDSVSQIVEPFEYTLIENYIVQPLVDFSPYEEEAEPIKAIYVSAPRAGSPEHLQSLVDLCNETSLNAMVIDVKTEDGSLTFKNGVDDELLPTQNMIGDIQGVIQTLNDNHIYSIARIVCFKDNSALNNRPELYIKNKDGTIWRDGANGTGYAWLNPYNKDSWDYILEIAKLAATLGFSEVQFDYIRFDTSRRLLDADFGDTFDKSRIQIITEFAQYAKDVLGPFNIKISADVYGAIISSTIDAETVGQDYVELSKIVDVICPMVYPSHYANHSMGIEYPDLQPYEIIYRAMEESKNVLQIIPEDQHAAVVRPWLQDFTATWINPHIVYGSAEREQQIKAVYDAGLTDWILWDAAVKYEKEGIF